MPLGLVVWCLYSATATFTFTQISDKTYTIYMTSVQTTVLLQLFRETPESRPKEMLEFMSSKAAHQSVPLHYTVYNIYLKWTSNKQVLQCPGAVSVNFTPCAINISSVQLSKCSKNQQGLVALRSLSWPVTCWYRIAGSDWVLMANRWKLPGPIKRIGKKVQGSTFLKKRIVSISN